MCQDTQNNDLQDWLRVQALDHVYSNVAVIDRDYRVVVANKSFEDTFGSWQGAFCYWLYKNRQQPCEKCPTRQTFEDGKSRVRHETGVDQHGKIAYYVLRTEPIFGKDGNVEYVIELSNDIIKTQDVHRVYHVLFDQVPCYVQILDRDLRVVRANERQIETFGESEGKHCYEVFRRRSTHCHPCPALLAFQDGKPHTFEQTRTTKDGRTVLNVVTAAPISLGDGDITHVFEIAMDVTAVRSLQSQLKKATALEESLIDNSNDGVIAFDEKGRVTVFNPAAEAILKCLAGEAVSGGTIKKMLPEEFNEVLEGQRSSCHFDETVVRAKDGEEVPVRFSGVHLMSSDGSLGSAVFFQDLRPIKSLELEKLEAERLAAVGETVAGLAHSIKNVLQALEGGMYAVRSGLKKKDENRMEKGWNVIEKNFDKVTGLVKDFLSFSKGRLPEARVVNPNDLVHEVVNLYKDVAAKSNVELVADLDESIAPAALDPSGIHTCLTNLLSNAIDACQMSDEGHGRVTIRTQEEDDVLRFEVMDDGVGMDHAVISRVFTTFFTTKGGGGTGLGLLTTRKIVQEHGGSISLDSEPGEGSVFRIELPRKRLPTPVGSIPDS